MDSAEAVVVKKKSKKQKTPSSSAQSSTPSFEPNNKRIIKLEPTGEAGLLAFQERLAPEEAAALAELKKQEPEATAGRSDPLLMRFLWARKLDVERSAVLLKQHIEWRKEQGIDEMDFATVETFLRQIGPALSWMPGSYTRSGHSVFFLSPGDINIDTVRQLGTQGMLKGLYYCLDLLQDHDIDYTRTGHFMVQDLSTASLSHMMSLRNTLDIKLWFESIQDRIPCRMSGIVVVNAPWYLRIILSIIKPLLRPKLRKRIHITTVEGLSEWFSSDQVPTTLGGKFPINRDWVEPLLEKRRTLSEGKYIDPAPRSEELIASFNPPTSAADVQ